MIGDGGVWILAPALTVFLAARCAVRHISRKRQGDGGESRKRKIGTAEGAKEKAKTEKKTVDFGEGEHISRPGARFGRGDVCFPRGTTTFHQKTAKMLFRLFVLLSCQ